MTICLCILFMIDCDSHAAIDACHKIAALLGKSMKQENAMITGGE